MGFSDICKLFARKMHFFLHYSPNIVLKSDFLHIIQQKKCIFSGDRTASASGEIGSGLRHFSHPDIRSSAQKGYICEVSDVNPELPQISFENNSII